MRSLIGSIVDRAPALVQPRNAVNVPLAASGAFGGMAGGTGAEGQLRSMGSVGILYSLTERITTAVAAAEWTLYRTAPSRLDEDRVPVTSHACIDLWESPNDHYTRPQLMEASGQHFELTGEAPILMSWPGAYRAAGPLEMWPIRPDRIEPETHPVKFITGWTYRAPDGTKITLGFDEVVRLIKPCPWDPFRGMGAVQTIAVELDSSRATAEWNRNFFRNSAVPGGVIEYADPLTDDDFDRIREHWRTQHQGVANAHRVAIIEGGKWADRSYSQRDMEFVGLRGATRDSIIEAFGVHKATLGITDDVNRAASIAARALFAEQIVVPRLARWRELLNRRILPLFGPTAAGLEWDFNDPTPPDAEAIDRERDSQTQAWARLVEAGADPAVAASVVGLPDIPLRPVVQVQPPAPAPEARARVRRARAHRPVNVDELPADPDAVDEVDLGPVQTAWEAALAALVAAWTGSVLADWIEQLVDQVRAALRGDAGRLADLQVDTKDAVRDVTDALVDLADTAAKRAAEESDGEASATVPRRGDLEDVARVTVELLGRGYELSAGREAQRLAGPAADPGDVADRVAAHLESLTDSEPEKQLGAALTTAQNLARASTFRSGPVASLYASEQLDANTCAPCRAAHGRFVCTTDDLTPLHLLYPTAGYVDCEGRTRCRGTVVRIKREGTGEDDKT